MVNGNGTKLPLPQLIDSTMLNTWRSCNQRFHRMYHEGYHPKGVSIDLYAGGLFADACREVRQQVFEFHKPLPDALLMAQARFFQNWGDIEPPPNKMKKGKDNVWNGVEAYFARWSPFTDDVQPFMTTEGKPTLEYTFSYPLEPITRTQAEGGFPAHPSDPSLPFMYGGKFDMLGTMKGLVVPLDEKTTSGIGPTWADQWNLRSQFIGYVWALQQAGMDCNNAVIRGIAFLTNEIKLAESIRPYSNSLIAKWYEQVRRDLWKIVQAYNDDYWDYNFGESCTAYGNCPFVAVCESPNPENWLTEFEVRHWSPLSHQPDPESLVNPMLTR